MRRGVFITGTDTEVGKTWVGTQLAARLYQQGLPLVVRKPAESGCARRNDQLLPADATAYWQALEQSQALADICPHRFAAPLAPVQAARLEHIRIELQDLRHSCEAAEQAFLLVEGAGGFYSPLAEDGLNADLAEALELPVLLVAADKLGCLNQILLTRQAILDRGLRLTAVVLNQPVRPSTESAEGTQNSHADMLPELLAEPILSTRSSNWLAQLSDLLQA